jgi:Spherulation-specific family 4
MLKKSTIIISLLAALSLPIGVTLNSMMHSEENKGAAVATVKKKEPVLQVLIPLYLYPSVVNGQSNWQPLADAAAKVPIVAIINPHNGPGGRPNSDYLAAMKLLQNAGVKMIGYVATNYGKRSWDQVKTDIDLYEKYFNVQGIFLDEAASEAKHLPHYGQIYNYIKSKAKLRQVVANPGTHIDEKYFSQPAADRAVIFENAGQEWPKYKPSSYLSKYSRQHFALMLHGVPDRQTMQQHLDLAVQRNIGYIYITNDLANSNPWDSFPSYWQAEVESIRAKNLAQ